MSKLLPSPIDCNLCYIDFVEEIKVKLQTNTHPGSSRFQKASSWIRWYSFMGHLIIPQYQKDFYNHQNVKNIYWGQAELGVSWVTTMWKHRVPTK